MIASYSCFCYRLSIEAVSSSKRHRKCSVVETCPRISLLRATTVTCKGTDALVFLQLLPSDPPLSAAGMAEWHLMQVEKQNPPFGGVAHTIMNPRIVCVYHTLTFGQVIPRTEARIMCLPRAVHKQKLFSMCCILLACEVSN